MIAELPLAASYVQYQLVLRKKPARVLSIFNNFPCHRLYNHTNSAAVPMNEHSASEIVARCASRHGIRAQDRLALEGYRGSRIFDAVGKVMPAVERQVGAEL